VAEAIEVSDASCPAKVPASLFEESTNLASAAARETALKTLREKTESGLLHSFMNSMFHRYARGRDSAKRKIWRGNTGIELD